MLIGLPPVTARYQILHSCVTELIRAGIISTTTSSVGTSSTSCTETGQQALPTYDELSTDDIDSITRRLRAMATGSSTDGSSDSYMNGNGVQQQQVICTLTAGQMHTRWCIIVCQTLPSATNANSIGIKPISTYDEQNIVDICV
jgi:hypothetical protein